MSTIACKEWAVVVRALLAGEQLLDLRKGGIREEGRHFDLRARRFWLSPTSEHQRADLVKPAYRRWVDETAGATREGSPRAFRLVQPIDVPWDDAYRGCASWVELAGLPDDPTAPDSWSASTSWAPAERDRAGRERAGRCTPRPSIDCWEHRCVLHGWDQIPPLRCRCGRWNSANRSSGCGPSGRAPPGSRVDHACDGPPPFPGPPRLARGGLTVAVLRDLDLAGRPIARSSVQGASRDETHLSDTRVRGRPARDLARQPRDVSPGEEPGAMGAGSILRGRETRAGCLIRRLNDLEPVDHAQNPHFDMGSKRNEPGTGVKPTVLFVNHVERACGVHQFGEIVYDAIRKSTKYRFQYVEVITTAELFSAVEQYQPVALLVNDHDSTLTQIPNSAFWETGLPLLGLIHETTDQRAVSATDTIFDLYIDHNPAGSAHNPRYLHSCRPIPTYVNAFPEPKLPTIGSFGFATPSKDFERIVEIAQADFDECVIRLSIPFSHFMDRDGSAARAVAARCRSIVTKPGVRLEVSHDFLPLSGVLDFLAQNSINVFIYKEQPARGVSSAVDLALAVDRPIALSRTSMFRHTFDASPSIFLEERSLREILADGVAPMADFRRNWTLDRIASDYDEAVDLLLAEATTRPPKLRGDQQRRRAIGASADYPPNSLIAPLEHPLAISYASSGEDARLLRVFGEQATGTYVDVGAGDPVEGSVTKLFYDRGWWGVNIEPGPRFSALQRARPRDVSLRMAVTDGAEMVTFHHFAGGWPSSTIVEERTSSFGAPGDWWPEQVPGSTLATIIGTHLAGVEIDFLKVDAEGAETAVLLSNDWLRFRPKVVVVEATMPWSARPAYADWEWILTTNDYLFAAFDGVNRFYVRSDQAALIPALAYPLGLLDRYEAYEAGATRAELVTTRHRMASTAAALRDASHQRYTTQRRLDEYQDEVAAVVAAMAAAADDRAAGLTNEAAEARARLDALLGSRTWRLGQRVSRALGPVKRVLKPPLRALVRRRRRRAAQERLSQTWKDAHLDAHPLTFRGAGEPATPVENRGVLWRARRRTTVEPAVTSASVADALRQAVAESDRHADLVLEDLGPSEGTRNALVQAELVAALAGRDRGTPTSSDTSLPWRSEEVPLVVVDVRCLQHPGFQSRGVGRHAAHVLRVIAAKYESLAEILLLGDPGLASIDPDLEALSTRTISTSTADDLAAAALFVSLSPMTASPGPALPYLLSPRVECVAVVYDFIPADFPDVYLAADEDWIKYQACLDALARYDSYLSISVSTAKRLDTFLGAPSTVTVTGVQNAMSDLSTDRGRHTRPAFDSYLLAPTGADPRKNLLTALAAHAYCHLHGHRSVGLVIAGRLPPGDVQAAKDFSERLGVPTETVEFRSELPDADLADLYSSAAVVLVPSLAEGLSLPVIEGVAAGTPVIASSIDAHRELIGDGWWLVPPDQPIQFGRAAARALKHGRRVANRQRKRLANHCSPADTTARVSAGLPSIQPRTSDTAQHGAPQLRHRSSTRSSRSKIAVLTPFPPQRSGVAHYTAFTLEALAEHADVVVYTSAAPAGTKHPSLDVRPMSIEPFFDDEVQAVVSVVGNSHFHVPILEYFFEFGGPCIAHDNRMAELYSWWRGNDYLAALLSRHSEPRVTADDIPWMFAHIDRLPSLVYDEIAARAEPLVVHAQGTADRIFEETSVRATVLPFVPYTFPVEPSVDQRLIVAAREALGWEEQTLHIATFGIVDSRGKGIDVLVDAVAWMTQWGVDCKLHVVGSGPRNEVGPLQDRAQALGIERHVEFTGWVPEEVMRRGLLAADIAVQLRTNTLAPLSGALLDCIAFGTPTIATQGLADEIAAPPYVRSLPDRFSSLLLAEAITEASEASRLSRAAKIEGARCDYLTERTAARYAKLLLEALAIEPTAGTK